MMETIFRNLISNAIKYSPEGGRIMVSGQALPDEALVTVSDQGVGIPFEEQPRVFERFYSLRRPDSGQKSSGLGLPSGLASAGGVSIGT